ncbi:branched-chain amino acid transport system II carrier protein [Paenibacillus sp. SC116]|uniref:branched-chain amino acid transport system II carrier protein n=1 Tax=Paenibacillus sp. SC116 TaxID=2968986 RepID=UPI00215ADDFD|nr:branched-chain amino acid transport system II carrier protein [Paenibacillus sp. SC116]MCR8842692.1 branched-chain amino acid transport system II carrier protein [Paenibacillus sp. SC116]
MQSLSKSHTFFIGLMLFSLFFGAGNLIFPPVLGQQSGEQFVMAMFGFILTGVGLPLLTIITIGITGKNMQQLAQQVHPKFGVIFAIAVYIMLGPLMAIPRVTNVSFEMGAQPFVPESLQSSSWILFLYSLIFFAVVYVLSLNPSKLVVWVGNILTPLLLLSITALFIAAVMNPLGDVQPAVGEYVTSPGFKGFMEGYLTLDAIAALAFGLIVINAIRDKGVQDKRAITKATIQAGIIAGIGLTLVYVALGYIGMTSVEAFGQVANGGQLLTLAVQELFGPFGLILLAVIVTLACLTTCIGLVSACSQYFSSLTKRISFNGITFLICLIGLLVANLGLNRIISISIPALMVMYPIAIVLIVLSLFNKLFGGRSSVYVGALIGTVVISLFDGLKAAEIPVGAVTDVLSYLPLYKEGIGWVVPALVGGLLGYMFGKLKQR